MHPKLKAFMRSEAMDCEVAATQASSSADGTIEDASEPHETAATVAAVATEVGEAEASQAMLRADPSQCHDPESGTTKPKHKCSESEKKRCEDSAGQMRQGRRETDQDLKWCSEGIAVFQQKDSSKKKTDGADSMDVDSSSKSEPSYRTGPARNCQRNSMMACFKSKPKSFDDVAQHSHPCSRSFQVPTTVRVGVNMPLLPVTLASKSECRPSIPHTYIPTNDIDMDTGESTTFTKSEPIIKREVLQLDTCALKTEGNGDADRGSVPRDINANSGLYNRSPFYPHNSFAMFGNLPIVVKTEPGVSGSCPRMQSCSSPLVGQTFVSRAPSQRDGTVDPMTKAASLPPMEALRRMQLEDLIRMNFVPFSPIKQESPCPGLLPFQSLHGTANRLPHFYRKPDPTSSANPAKMFTCQQCGATFKHRHHVVRHMRAHTGEKPFRCEECGAMFARKCILTNHIRTHTGEKPYVCAECGDAFSRKHHLVIHRRTHTGEKPYICTVCTTAFARSHHLNRHLKTHLLMQGHLPPPSGDTGIAIDLSLHKVGDGHAPIIDLGIPKPTITDVNAITQVFNIGTDYAMGISNRSCSTTET